MIRPVIQIKSVEGNALFADSYFNEVRTDLRVEAISVHSEVEGRIPQPNKPWINASKMRRAASHSPAKLATVRLPVGVLRYKNFSHHGSNLLIAEFILST